MERNKFNYICMRTSHRYERPKDNKAIEAYMLSWAKKKGLRVWGFKGKENNSQEDGKSKDLAIKCLQCHTETVGHGKDLEQIILASFPQLTTPGHHNELGVEPMQTHKNMEIHNPKTKEFMLLAALALWLSWIFWLCSYPCSLHSHVALQTPYAMDW